MSLSVFNVFLYMGYEVVVRTHTGEKKEGELQLCQTFHMQSDRPEVK